MSGQTEVEGAVMGRFKSFTTVQNRVGCRVRAAERNKKTFCVDCVVFLHFLLSYPITSHVH